MIRRHDMAGRAASRLVLVRVRNAGSRCIHFRFHLELLSICLFVLKKVPLNGYDDHEETAKTRTGSETGVSVTIFWISLRPRFPPWPFCMLLRLMKKKAAAAHRRVESSLGGNGGRFEEEEEEEEHVIVVWKTSFSVPWKWFRGWWRGTLKRLAGPDFSARQRLYRQREGRRTDITLR